MLANELNTKESSGLLSAVDRMREILHNEKITLPEIVVVGDQSVGKSSVLEAISGIQLPRAQNICTRCPLELRMKLTTGSEYAVIRNSNNSEDQATTISDMNAIGDAVTDLTREIAGEGTSVSSVPIYLTVFKRNIPYDLTLIDLPGITRNPLPGQAKDIHSQILNLINKYIEPETAVVLHVIPASVDFTTSESMKLAKEYDPQCLRQLIAASKIDKYDKGIAEKLLGRGAGAMQLQLGCVAVLNRNQDEIDQNVSFEEMKEREAQFFIKHHEAFQHLPEQFKGIDQLVKRLALIQHARIRSTLPQVIDELRRQIREKKLELKTIPLAMTSEQDCWMKFQSMINILRDSIRSKVNGDYDQSTRINMINVAYRTSMNTFYSTISSTFKSNKASIDSTSEDNRLAYHVYNYQKRFKDELSRSFSNFSSSEYHRLVLQAIDDAAGVSLPNFPSYQIIERLFRAELKRLPEICSNLIERMRDYLRESLLRIFDETFDSQYVRLLERLKDVIIKQIDAAENRADERVREILDMECRVFTINDEYMDTVKNMKSIKETEQKGQSEPPSVIATMLPSSTLSANATAIKLPGNNATSTSNLTPETSTPALVMPSLLVQLPCLLTSNEVLAAGDIQIALDSYCSVVRRRIIDSISQTCYYHYITRCVLVIDQDLTMACPSSDLVRFMREPADQTSRRDNLTRTIKAYEEALRLGQDHL